LECGHPFRRRRSRPSCICRRVERRSSMASARHSHWQPHQDAIPRRARAIDMPAVETDSRPGLDLRVQHYVSQRNFEPGLEKSLCNLSGYDHGPVAPSDISGDRSAIRIDNRHRLCQAIGRSPTLGAQTVRAARSDPRARMREGRVLQSVSRRAEEKQLHERSCSIAQRNCPGTPTVEPAADGRRDRRAHEQVDRGTR